MNTGKITTRVAEERDIPGMAALRAEQWGDGIYWAGRIAGYLSGNVNPQKALPARVIYVAVKEDEVVGFIAGHLTHRFGCEGELEWINVAQSHRRQSIAFILLQQLATWFTSMQARYICVNCDADNTAAQNFYKRNGAEALNEHWLTWKDISILQGGTSQG